MARPDVVVAGHICLDITPLFAEKRSLPLEHVLIPGKLTLMEGVEISPGGAVSNTGLALARLGYSTALVGKCGDDALAGLLEETLEARGGKARLTRTKESRTSYSVILAPPATDRIFLHDPGANDTFAAADLDLSVLQGARLLHFGYPPVMRVLYENDGAELEALLEGAQEAGVAVSLDMALPDPDSEAGRLDWESIIRRIAPWVDIFLPSFEELALMLDRPLFEELVERAGHGDMVDVVTPDELGRLGDRLTEFEIPIGGIKFGHRGFYLRTGKGERLSALCKKLSLNVEAWRRRELFSESFEVEDLASATGAGDASIGGFLAALLDHRQPEGALTLACAAGAQICRRYDAQSGLESLVSVDAAIESGWRRHRSEAFAGRFRYQEDKSIWVGPADSGFDTYPTTPA